VIINVRKGNLFESTAQTLVNTVNTVGIMGKGIALEFKKRFPEMYADYMARCEAGEVRLGEPYLYRNLLPPWILNFPTKEHWRSVSRLDAIIAGLEYLEGHLEDWGIRSLAVPPLGCGNGQLEWDVVGPTLYRHLNRLPVAVELFAPTEVDDASTTREFLADASGAKAGGGRYVPPPLVALAAIVERLTHERYSWPVGHTRFQKICYFADSAGLPTTLRFEERSFGPFADGLKKVVARLVNNGLLTEEASGRYQLLRPGATFDDARTRFGYSLREFEPVIDRVVDLFLRLNPARTELAATVHFTATSLAKRLGRSPTDEEVFVEVRRWKRAKFDAGQVTAALASLHMLGWLDLSGTPLLDAELDPESAEAVA
jgi:O-acetyl-ADP-ribose deacetylase (regulator of RNase III)